MARKSQKHRSRKMRGGSGPYSSATTYGGYVNGSGNSQFSRVFDQGGAYGQVQGNNIIGTGGQGVISPTQMPTSSQLSLIQKAGGRRRRRGGFLGEVINQAIVPVALLGMQQTYGRRRGSKRHRTRKHRRY